MPIIELTRDSAGLLLSASWWLALAAYLEVRGCSAVLPAHNVTACSQLYPVFLLVPLVLLIQQTTGQVR